MAGEEGKYFAGGFLFHAESGRVLLQFRGTRTEHSPNTWCFLGGWSEEEDGGDAGATWRREMREEIGVAIAPGETVPLCDYAPESSPYRRHIFYCAWPSLADDFPLPEDEHDLERVAWFTVEEALALRTLLTDGTRRDLLVFQQRLAQQRDA